MAEPPREGYDAPMWTRRKFLIAPVAAALPTALATAVVPLGGCAGANANRKGGSKEESHLIRSAEIYWHSVRWADAEKASVFIADPSQRLLFKEWLERQSDKRRYEEATVIQVVLGEERDKPVDGRTREAVVFVRARGYELPEQILQTWKYRQTWYRTTTGWFVEWEDPEGGLDAYKPETGPGSESDTP
jgi:hypothetical protein